jgi:hypothetical protein
MQVTVEVAPAHPDIVVVASKDVGAVPEVVGQTGTFASIQLYTFCPVSDDTALPTVKQVAAAPVPYIPSAN